MPPHVIEDPRQREERGVAQDIQLIDQSCKYFKCKFDTHPTSPPHTHTPVLLSPLLPGFGVLIGRVGEGQEVGLEVGAGGGSRSGVKIH